MNPKIKKKFVIALRSGKYKQIRSCLHDSEGFCPVGILADVLGVRWIDLEDNRFGFCSGSYSTEVLYTSTLSSELMDYAEISDAQLQSIFGLNDIDRKTLLEISDWVEENL